MTIAKFACNLVVSFLGIITYIRHYMRYLEKPESDSFE